MNNKERQGGKIWEISEIYKFDLRGQSFGLALSPIYR